MLIENFSQLKYLGKRVTFEIDPNFFFMRLFLLFSLIGSFFLSTFAGYSQAPTITSVSPAYASFGQTLTINGTNLSNTTFVTIYGDLASDVQVISPTQITVILPLSNSNMGGPAVYLENGSGNASFAGFNYCPTTIADFTVSFNASNIAPEAYSFCFGDSIILALPSGYVSYEWVGENKFSQTLVLGSSKTAWYPQVRVTDANGCVITRTYTQEYNFTTTRSAAPELSNSGIIRICAGTPKVISENFNQNLVWSTGEIASSISVGTDGNYWAVSKNGTCISDTAFFTIESYPPPTINSISDNTIYVGQEVSLIGTGFLNVGAVMVGNYSSTITSATDTEIKFIVPVGADETGISVISACNTTFYSYSIIPPVPQITSFSPLYGAAGQTLTINGANFSSVTRVTLFGIEATNLNIISPTQLSVTIPGYTKLNNQSIIIESPIGNSDISYDFELCEDPTVFVFYKDGLTSLGNGNYSRCKGQTASVYLPVNFVSYNWTGVTANSNTASITSDITVPITLVGTDVNGCIYSLDAGISSVSTVARPAPQLSIGTRATYCPYDSAFIANINPSGTMIWSTGQTDDIISVKTPGNYWVYTDDDGCQSDTTFFTAEELALPQITSLSDSSLTVGQVITVLGSNLATVDFVDVGGVTVPSNRISDTELNFTVPAGAGTSGISFFGLCIKKITDYTVNPSPPQITSVLPARVSEGDSVFIFGTDLSSVTGLLIFGNPTPILYNSNTLIKAIVPVNVIFGTQPVLLLSPLGDALSSDLSLCANQTITITKSDPVLGVDLCFGNTLTLYGPAGYDTYFWSDGQTTQNATFTEFTSLPGIINLTVTNAQGCSYVSNFLGAFTYGRTASIAIGTQENRTIMLASNDAINLIDANGVYSNIRWSTGETATSIRITQPGSYWAVGINPEGCVSDTGRITITEALIPNPPALNLPFDTSICGAINFNITTSTDYQDAQLYVELNGANGQLIDYTNQTNNVNITEAGTYTFRVINKLIGLNSASTPVTRVITSLTPEKPQVNVPSAGFCSSNPVNVQITNINPLATYVWGNGTFGTSANISTTGTYWLISSVNTCSSDTTFFNYTSSPDPDAPTAGLSANEACAGNSVSLNWTTTSPGVKIYLNGQPFSTETTSSGSKAISLAGDYIVKSYEPGTGCESSVSAPTLTFSLFSVPSLPITNAPTTPVCLLSGVAQTIEIMAPNPGYSYTWSNGTFGTAADFTTGGSNWVFATGLNGCRSDTAFFNLERNDIPDQPLASITSTTICPGTVQNISWTASTASVRLYFNAVLDSEINSSNGSIQTTKAGEYILKAYNPVSGCESTINPIVFNTVIPEVPEIVRISFQGDSVLCTGESATILVNSSQTIPNLTYRLSDGQISNSPSFTVSTSGLYTVTIQTDLSCISAVSNSIFVASVNTPNAPTIVSNNTSGVFCEGDSVILQSADLQPVLWSDNSRSSRLIVKTPGSYSARLTAQRCTSAISNEVVLTQLPKPAGVSINQQGPITLCPNATTVLTSTSLQPGFVQAWTRNGEPYSFTSGDLVVDFPGTYSVRNFNGSCFSEVSAPIDIIAVTTTQGAAQIVASTNEICPWSTETDQIVLSASNRGTGMFYSWSKDGLPISTRSITDTLTVDEPGLYKLFAFDGNNCGTVDSILITKVVSSDYPEIQVISGTGCRGDSLVLGSTVPFSFYFWSNGSTASTVKTTGETPISLTAGNSLNCMATSKPFGFISLPRPDLCQVSVLDTTNINQIVWVKAPVGLGIDSVIILREERGLNNLKIIGKVDFDERPEFLDKSQELNTNRQNYRYRVQFLDSCGRRSLVSDSSRTMFLRVGKALGGGNNLFWTPYEGEPAKVYYIARRQRGGGPLSPIDSVPGNIRTYTDRRPDANDSTEYQIWFERSAICSQDKAGVRTSRSNTRPAVPVPPPPRSNSRVFFRPCPGATVTFGNVTFNTSGTYTVYVRDRNNLDSAVVVNVTVARKDTTRLTQRLCNGRNILFGNQLILTAGTYQRSIPNNLGCDSTIFLTVDLDPKDSIGTVAEVCQGAVYSFEGQNYTASGTYFRYLQNRLGCDSIRSLVLTVNPLPAVPVITLLPGDTLSASGSGIFTWSVNGNVIPTITQSKIPIPPIAANYSVTITDANGCEASSQVFAFAGFSWNKQAKSKVLIYPNPSTGSITLSGLPDVEQPAIIRNPLGQIVWQGSVLNNRNINLDHLASGSYLLEVNSTQIRLIIAR